MIGAHPIAGYAIVSADGMIADANGVMPETIRNDADQRFLQAALDRAAAVVHGRHSYEGGPRAPARKRLIVTHSVAAIAPDASHANSLLWNPAGAPLENALAALGIGDGIIAVIGGTGVFGQFLPYYDIFNLTTASRAIILGGQPLFPQVGVQATVEQVLAGEGLRPTARRDLDAAAGIALTTWERGLG